MDITTDCNLRCVMCARKQEIGGEDLTPGAFQDLADRVLPRTAVLDLSCGSEPLVSEHFEEVLGIVAARRRGGGLPWVQFVTNGLLLDEHRIRKIVDTGVAALEVSFDAATPETYARIRLGGDFDRLLSNLRLLRRFREMRGTRRPHLKAGFVMMRSNIEEVPRFVELAADLGATEANLKHLVPLPGTVAEPESLFGHQELCDRMLRDAEVVAATRGLFLQAPPPFSASRSERRRRRVRQAWRALRAYGPGFAADSVRRALRRGRLRRVATCDFPSTHLFVSPDGTVRPCGVWYGQAPMGNLRHQTFAEIWASDGYRTLRREHAGELPLRDVCRFCPSLASRRLDASAFRPVA